MKFTDIKNQIKDLWEYDDEFVWTSDIFSYFSTTQESNQMTIKGEYFLEFYNDANDNFFRIYDSKGNNVGFVEGKDLKKMQVENDFVNLIFNDGNFMFSTYKPI